MKSKRTEKRRAGVPIKTWQPGTIALTDNSKGEELVYVIAESMPEAVALVDADQRYLFANTACRKWFGIKQVEGLSIRKVYGEEVYAILRPTIEKAVAGQTAEYEGYMPYRKIGRRYVHIDFLPRVDANGRAIAFNSVLRDLTNLKEAEERFRIFVENAPVAIIIHSSDGQMVVVSSEAQRMFGYSREEVVGKPVEILIPERLRRKYAEERAAYMMKPRVRPMGTGLELSAKRKDGSEFAVEVSLSPVKTSSGTFVSATIFDLTNRKRLEEQTRLATVLQERARVARDLHDTLAQGFTGIIMNLEAAREASGNRPETAQARLTTAEKVARENLEKVRQSLMELAAPTIRRVEPLDRALRELVKRADSNGNTQVKFSLRGKPRPLNAVVGENLLFIAQQAIDNALRHGHAKVVRVGLGFNGKVLRLSVQDDGQGFDANDVKHGIGLTSMSDRASSVGGNFVLESRPGRGTLAEVTLPFPGKQSRESSQ